MRILVLLFLLYFACSCVKPETSTNENVKTELVPFTVTVVQRNPNTAVIEWTAGTNVPAAVKYKVSLDGRLIKSGLTKRVDTLQSLSANLSYSGTVCVYTQAGDSAFAHFTLPKLSSNPRPLRPFTVKVIDRAPATATIEWTEAVNLYDSEIVMYDVMLQGQMVHTKRLNLTDTLTNLYMDSVYTGKVLAYTAAGDTASASFQLSKLNGFIFYGAGDNGMVCYNLFSGERVWKSEISSDEFLDMPTISDSVLYVNAAMNDRTGICAFNAKTGKNIWRTPLAILYFSANNFNPVYKDNVVYTVLSTGIYALNAKTGQVLWSYTPANREFTDNPVIGGNQLFVSMRDTDTPPGFGIKQRMVALNISNGSVAWENTINYTVSHNPVVYNNQLIYGASNGKVYALSQSTGEINWSRDFSVSYNNLGSDAVSPVVHNDIVLVHNRDRGYYALNAQTGVTIWNYSDVTLATSPTVGNGVAYFATSSPNMLIALNIATGALVWQTPLEAFVFSPIFVNNRIYLSTYSGFIIFNAINGQFLKRLSTISGTNSHGWPAVVADNQVYYAAESGMTN